MWEAPVGLNSSITLVAEVVTTIRTVTECIYPDPATPLSIITSNG